METTATALDPLIFGRRVRYVRKRKGMTLSDLAGRVGKHASYLSMIETGRREPRLSAANDLANALGIAVAELLIPEPPTARDRLEVELLRLQRHPTPGLAPLPPLSVSGLPTDVLEHLVAVHTELRQRLAVRAATPEEARRANAELRRDMRQRDNYYPEIERVAAETLENGGYTGSGALSQKVLTQIAAHLGFDVHPTAEIPTSVRSVADLRLKRIYVPQRDALPTLTARSVILQTLGHFVLGHTDPKDFGDFLRQRVEANYFAGAVLISEMAAVPMLEQAKKERDLAVEDLRDMFYVSYEMAGHRFTNLATKHLGIQTHFIRSDEEGVIWKAYENDGVPFPVDADGAIEGNHLCRRWGTRTVFSPENRFGIHHQLTDTPVGTFWCATHIESDRDPEHAITVGARFEDAICFRRPSLKARAVSRCPSPECCQVPASSLSEKWDGFAWPTARTDTHVLAALPPGRFPGVNLPEVYEFLERQSVASG